MRTLCATLAVVLGAAVSGAAAANRIAQSANGDPVRVSVIGCVQATRSATETTATTAIPAGETKYVLSNITLVPSPTARGSEAAIVTEAVKLYRLDDAADAKIAPHVGDRVQVTGTVVQRPASPTGTSGRAEPMPGVAAPTLRVESMQKVSSDSSACLAR